jgi:hypothetical protein
MLAYELVSKTVRTLRELQFFPNQVHLRELGPTGFVSREAIPGSPCSLGMNIFILNETWANFSIFVNCTTCKKYSISTTKPACLGSNEAGGLSCCADTSYKSYNFQGYDYAASLIVQIETGTLR